MENEDLISYGLPEDVWFHVDKLSSAHVYARLRPGEGQDDMPPELVEDCAQVRRPRFARAVVINRRLGVSPCAQCCCRYPRATIKLSSYSRAFFYVQ